MCRLFICYCSLGWVVTSYTSHTYTHRMLCSLYTVHMNRRIAEEDDIIASERVSNYVRYIALGQIARIFSWSRTGNRFVAHTASRIFCHSGPFREFETLLAQFSGRLVTVICWPYAQRNTHTQRLRLGTQSLDPSRLCIRRPQRRFVALRNDF